MFQYWKWTRVAQWVR